MCDTQEFVGLVQELAEAVAHLRTPWRGQAEVFTGPSPAGPRAPVSAAVIDLEQEVQRTLLAIVQEYRMTVGSAPAGLDTGSLVAWLIRNGARVSEVLHDGDLADLRILRDRAVRMSGLHDDDEKAAVALAEARRRALPGASHYGSASEVARLSTAAGRPVTDKTVTAWAAKGRVDTRGELYSLDDVLIYHDEQCSEHTREYGDGYHGPAREVAELAEAAGLPVSHMTVTRWALQGLVRRTEMGYSLDDVFDRLIAAMEPGAA